MPKPRGRHRQQQEVVVVVVAGQTAFAVVVVRCSKLNKSRASQMPSPSFGKEKKMVGGPLFYVLRRRERALWRRGCGAAASFYAERTHICGLDGKTIFLDVFASSVRRRPGLFFDSLVLFVNRPNVANI